MTSLGTPDRPLRVAIIGAGPSGFYAADALFRSDLTVKVDAFDRLPTPYGLLRGGVAPDHQKMKSVASYYERVAMKNAEHFRFIGNIEVGKDIAISDLQTYYDALVFSYGAESDKKTGLPGEDLHRSYSSREFVGWYNGHPDYRDLEFDLSQESVAIIGQGNVAVDVARILAKTPEELASSDISQHALDALSKSKVKEIHMIGRRGPVQAAFTELEVRELGKLEDCDLVVHKKDLELDEANKQELEEAESNKARKNYAAMQDLAGIETTGKSKKIEIRFFQAPREIIGNDAGEVTELKLERIQLAGEAFNQKAVRTGEMFTIDCGLLFRSIGYKGLGLPGLPFNADWGVIPNEKGRVTDENGQTLPGLYTSGWIKRGPSGVLGTNKPCSKETIDCLLEDVSSLTPCDKPGLEEIDRFLSDKGLRAISFEEWQRIDAKEKENGEKVGKPREKFTRIDEFLSVIQPTNAS